MQSMKLGKGGRFEKLSKELSRKGIRNPNALAAKIGMKKYGKKKMLSWALKERKK